MMSIEKSDHLAYATKVWATSAIGTPIFAGFVFALISQESDLGILVLLAIGVGFILSFPCYIFLTWSAYFVNTSELNYTSKKITLNFIGVLFNIILFQIVFLSIFDSNDDSGWITLAYSVSITLSIWIYPLTITNHVPLPKSNPNRKYLEDILDDENYGKQ